jgi:hypothetical protein
MHSDGCSLTIMASEKKDSQLRIEELYDHYKSTKEMLVS